MFWKKDKQNRVEIIKAKTEALKIVSDHLNKIEENIWQMTVSDIDPISIYCYKNTVSFYTLKRQREMLIKEITNG